MTLSIQKCPFTFDVENARFGIKINGDGLYIYFQIECESVDEESNRFSDSWTSKAAWIESGPPALSTPYFKVNQKLNLAKFPFEISKADESAKNEESSSTLYCMGGFEQTLSNVITFKSRQYTAVPTCTLRYQGKVRYQNKKYNFEANCDARCESLNVKASSREEADKLVALHLDDAEEFTFDKQQGSELIYKWTPTEQGPAKKQKTTPTVNNANNNNNTTPNKPQQASIVNTVSTDKPVDIAEHVKRLEIELGIQKVTIRSLEDRIKSLEDTLQQLTKQGK